MWFLFEAGPLEASTRSDNPLRSETTGSKVAIRFGPLDPSIVQIPLPAVIGII